MGKDMQSLTRLYEWVEVFCKAGKVADARIKEEAKPTKKKKGRNRQRGTK
jgi:hypothetical protein